MKKRYILFLVFCLVLFVGLQYIAKPPEIGNFDKSSSASSFVVLELFTSEGCSSCPPADKYFGELAKVSREKQQPIYCLSFHVDYWDYLGWKDPYAQSQFTQRQRRYNQQDLKGRKGLYTPQVIVNGTQVFVGSDRKKGNQLINESLKQSSALKIECSAKVNLQKDLTVVYEVEKAPRNSVLNLALVQDSAIQVIKAGENSGSTLEHHNVVRSFDTIDLSQTQQGQVLLPIPENIQLSQAVVIVYAQDAKSKQVLGAQRCLIN